MASLARTATRQTRGKHVCRGARMLLTMLVFFVVPGDEADAGAGVHVE